MAFEQVKPAAVAAAVKDYKVVLSGGFLPNPDEKIWVTGWSVVTFKIDGETIKDFEGKDKLFPVLCFRRVEQGETSLPANEFTNAPIDSALVDGSYVLLKTLIDNKTGLDNSGKLFTYEHKGTLVDIIKRYQGRVNLDQVMPKIVDALNTAQQQNGGLSFVRVPYFAVGFNGKAVNAHLTNLV